MSRDGTLISWAIELQGIAQAGLAYTPNEYDRERFERVRTIAAEMVSHLSDEPIEKVSSLFCLGEGYPTPKLDTRGAIFEGGKVLLVQERDGRWALPGGWVDVNCTLRENVIKEVREEAGLTVRAVRLIALLDRDKHNPPRYVYPIVKTFIECETLGGAFVPNIETIATGYFTMDELPPLATEKCTAKQIEMCFHAHADPEWSVVFD